MTNLYIKFITETSGTLVTDSMTFTEYINLIFILEKFNISYSISSEPQFEIECNNYDTKKKLSIELLKYANKYNLHFKVYEPKNSISNIATSLLANQPFNYN